MVNNSELGSVVNKSIIMNYHHYADSWQSEIHPIWDIANGTAYLIHKVGPEDAGRYIESCWVLNYLNPCWSAFAWGL